jgi:GT2 family glycosyltransferase
MNPTTSVVILCQPAEAAVTALTLGHLIRDLDPTVSIHVLMNGGFAGEVRALAPTSPSISYHSSPMNLGVARGRNFLLRRPEVRASDVIVILDNDVITPPGHIGRLVEALMRDSHVAVIGPAIVDLRGVAEALGLDSGGLRAPISNTRLVQLGAVLHEASSWFHLGAHPDWRAVYQDELRIERRLLRRAGADVEPFPELNHQNPAIRAAIADGATEEIEASNIAGCCQAFRTDLLDEIGYLRDEFSPYGYEDVEFCIRAARAGKRNYVDPTIFMLHGTDRRHLERRTPEGAIVAQRNLMRCKSLLAWRHANATWQDIVERSILRRYLLAYQAGRPQTATVQLRAHIAGSLEAQRQIRHALATEGNPQ